MGPAWLKWNKAQELTVLDPSCRIDIFPAGFDPVGGCEQALLQEHCKQRGLFRACQILLVVHGSHCASVTRKRSAGMSRPVKTRIGNLRARKW